MKTTSFHYRSLESYAIPITFLVLIGVNTPGENAHSSQNRGDVADGRRGDKQDAKTVAKMVEAIANHNKPPKIVSRRRALPIAWTN